MASCVAQSNKITIQKESELETHYIAFSQSLPYHIHEIYP